MRNSKLIIATSTDSPTAELEYLKGRPKKKYTEQLNLTELVDIKGWKARGNRLSKFEVVFVDLIKEEIPPATEEAEVEVKVKTADAKKNEDKKEETGQANLFD